MVRRKNKARFKKSKTNDEGNPRKENCVLDIVVNILKELGGDGKAVGAHGEAEVPPRPFSML